jgi:hypothetical protein
MLTNEQEALNEHSDDTFLIAYNVNNNPICDRPSGSITVSRKQDSVGTCNASIKGEQKFGSFKRVQVGKV